ncbi:MAG: S-methyl-5'-thioadenosine phosphorylase [Elusimicrobiota bacterium]
MKDQDRARIGVIGGSGLYEMKGITRVKEARVKTPYGPPSGPIVLGDLAGVRCAFLPRHGRGHILLPSEIPQRANIWALKSLGVERILAVSAVGSLKEELPPRRFVFPDQLIDRTKGRPGTFFGDGVVAHVAFDKPFCAEVSKTLHAAAQGLGIASDRGGTYVCMEGPAFSTRAESELHRSMGASLIGMTASPEAKLAREAELCYGLAALVTDYDCWKEGEEVSTEKVVETLVANVANAQRLLAAAIPALASLPRTCRCASALSGALFTAPSAMAPKTLKKLDLLVGKYVKKGAPK